MALYNADFPVGSEVRIADRLSLERFKNDWKYHHPLNSGQLEFAGMKAEVASIGYYHRGDVLYWLEEIPGVWHEQCLAPFSNETNDQGDTF